MYTWLLFYLLLATNSIKTTETVLLTGGAGFIGSHTAKALLQHGYRVIIVDNMNDYYDPTIKRTHLAQTKLYATDENLIFYQLDITDKVALEALWEKENPSLVCHLAAAAGISSSVKNPESCITTNVLGSLRLFELAHKYRVKNFVFASSSSVYGNKSSVPFQETDAADMPCSPYAMSKRATELLAYTYHHLYKIPCTGLRFFTVYGPCGRTDMAPFIFLDKIYREQPITLFGDGTKRMRDFTYIDDIVHGIIKALQNPHDFELINLGRGEPITLHELIKTIEEITQKKATIIEKEVPAGDADITYADISKAESMLDYHPTVSLAEGMKRMFSWYLKDYLPEHL